MDIERPCLTQQVAPAPWLVRREKQNVSAAVREAAVRLPTATVDQLVADLRERGMQVSGMIVAMDMPPRRVVPKTMALNGPCRPDDDRDADWHEEAAIDEALQESFPASDPPSFAGQR